MATERHDPEAQEKKVAKPELRDLKPKKDVNGGGRKIGNGEKRPPGRTGEIDFMNWD